MPRVTTHEYVGCGFAVDWREVPDLDPRDGQLRKGMNGAPRLLRQAVIVVQDPGGDGVPVLHRIPLDEEARKSLVEQLTSGIVLP